MKLILCSAEAPILWPPEAKNCLTGKDPDAEKDWRQEEKGTSEDEMVGWHHWLNRHEFEQTPGIREWTGKPGMLQSMGSQRVGHNWVTELNWTNNVLLFLLYYRYAFKELHYCTVCPPLSLVLRETVFQPIITGKWVFTNCNNVPILYYEYDYNAVCHKNFTTIHLLVCRLLLLLLVSCFSRVLLFVTP